MQDYLDYLPYSCFVTDQMFTFKIKTLPAAIKISKSTKVNICI
jgi:hypothetical protein